MAKLPNGCTIEKVKDSRGKILAYELRQGDRHWSAPTEAEALAARETDIQRATEECDFPILLTSPTNDPTEIALLGYRVLGAWRYGFVRKPTAHGLDLECFGGSGEYKTRAECERSMRCHAAQMAVRIGPFDGGSEIICDGLAYLVHEVGHRVNSIKEFHDQMVYVAYCRAHEIAKAKKLESGFPRSEAAEFTDAAQEAERRRIHEVYTVLNEGCAAYAYNVAESFRQGRLVSRR